MCKIERFFSAYVKPVLSSTNCRTKSLKKKKKAYLMQMSKKIKAPKGCDEITHIFCFFILYDLIVHDSLSIAFLRTRMEKTCLISSFNTFYLFA